MLNKKLYQKIRVPLAMLLGAIVVYLSLTLTSDSKLLNSPLDLAPGKILSPEFNIKQCDAYYEVALYVDRGLPSQELNCLLGIEPDSARKCSGIESIIDISWKLYEEDKFIKEGQWNKDGGVWAKDFIGNRFGYLPLETNKNYKLEFTIRKDAAKLAKLNPRIMVSPISKGENSCQSRLFYLFLGSLLIGFSGIIMILIETCSYYIASFLKKPKPPQKP